MKWGDWFWLLWRALPIGSLTANTFLFFGGYFWSLWMNVTCSTSCASLWWYLVVSRESSLYSCNSFEIDFNASVLVPSSAGISEDAIDGMLLLFLKCTLGKFGSDVIYGIFHVLSTWLCRLTLCQRFCVLACVNMNVWNSCLVEFNGSLLEFHLDSHVAPSVLCLSKKNRCFFVFFLNLRLHIHPVSNFMFWVYSLS